MSDDTDRRKEKIKKVIEDNPYSSRIDREELEDIEKQERKKDGSREVEF